jgi:Biopolymer transport proteins
MMAGTLAESLTTTALGLLVAVPTVWSYNYLSESAELMTIEMEVAIRELKTYLVMREAKSSSQVWQSGNLRFSGGPGDPSIVE